MEAHRFDERRPGAYQAQHGEDRWLERYFAGKRNGFFVDVGAYDGVVISNTYFLETIGWTGVLIEANPRKAALCRQNRPGSRVFECAAVSSPDVAEVRFLDVPEGEVYSTIVPSEFNMRRLHEYGLSAHERTIAARTLDSILAEVGPTEIDFVTIDVEGAEIDVLKGFDIARWRPGLVMVESPPARSAEIRDYFTVHGYAYRHSISVNDIYARLPDGLPFRAKLAATVDGLWYRIEKAAQGLREKVRLRTRLRDLGLWPPSTT